jgi:hypothetical protein
MKRLTAARNVRACTVLELSKIADTPMQKGMAVPPWT